MIPEIDKTVISRKGIIKFPNTFNDNIGGCKWLLVIIDRNDIRNFRIFIDPNRKVETIETIFKEYVEPITTIVTDGHPTYPKAVINKNCFHIVVPRVNGFVNPEKESINKIENLWSHLKDDIRKAHGVKADNMENFYYHFGFVKNISPIIQKN